ncbi:hypothetical protein COCSUDRAFT_59379 [Coccomyxa subellipsoidea C-169]|uniref:F-box domain-containing protein n=1 Tax=Coccomyxa subellipsoidea (strain C-169) TaxID=574566 RepID=I0Z8A3_COCSC|nr:hypothetical protein COCSUDRAFT_59379 [Coccomyxa subellipsoidea C-169]EIE26872.1 hypothetical protein COCSUDRAFT_59379 [Coccomyxa subellipsoidea C-169]|eukprot:XP_005651416.1 hypothetical protein COCSUDRAFT_59379 [Coccomyxa subellipsoidea C-169]
MQVSGGFGRLTGLSFRASPQSEEDKEHHKMAVAWLLGQAKELVFLSLDLVGLPYLPHLSHIQHLQLDVSGGAFPRLAPVLTTLVTLRTLYLESTETQGAQEEATGLDLQTLTELESVMLDGAVPSALTLAEGTSLRVTVSQMPHHTSLPPEIWQAIARYLSARDWARVAGVCKTTWQLRLPEVRIKQNELRQGTLCREGAAWLLKRAQLARELLLDLPGDIAELQATLTALMQDKPRGWNF